MKQSPIERKKPWRPKRRTPEEVKQAKKDKAAKKREDRKAGKRIASDLVRKADNLARAYCHSVGRCEAAGEHGIRCSNRLEWCHAKGRTNMYIRHDPLNFFCMCNTHHRFFTNHPDYWKAFVDKARPGAWDRINAILIEKTMKRLKADYEYWIDFYTRNPVRHQ